MSSMNMMELQQLTVHKEFTKNGNTKDTLKPPHRKFNDLIVELATKNPLWRFVVSDIRFQKEVYQITVLHYGEELGYIQWSYFRGDYGFAISNDRIERARERTSAYKTHDEKKALVAIKKTFSPKNVRERVAAASEAVRKLVGTQAYEKHREYLAHDATLTKKALEFVALANDQFQTYLRSRNQFHIYEKVQEAEIEMQALKNLQANLAKCAVVVQVDGGYIVKVGDKVAMMDDTTLPHSMKAKLGMLKLVDDEHFIANIGGKVKADVFVLAPEEGESK
jgi:hypothetical protein